MIGLLKCLFGSNDDEGRLPMVNECPNCYAERDISDDECDECGQDLRPCSPFGAV